MNRQNPGNSEMMQSHNKSRFRKPGWGPRKAFGPEESELSVGGGDLSMLDPVGKGF